MTRCFFLAIKGKPTEGFISQYLCIDYTYTSEDTYTLYNTYTGTLMDNNENDDTKSEILQAFKEIDDYVRNITTLDKEESSHRESDLLKAVNTKASALFQELQDLIKTAKALKNMKYKAGDIVHHPKHGPSFILAINLPLLIKNNNSFGYGSSISVEEVGYILIGVQAEKTGSRVNKYFAKEDELVPYSDATKILYGNK